MQQPSIGSIVHYVLPDGPNAGQHRPAIIVRTWGDGDTIVNLQLFIDGGNDGGGSTPGTGPWQTSVHEDPTGKTGRTWHYPEVPAAIPPA